MKETKRLVIGITGSSGVIYGIRLLEVLKGLDYETHLVMSPSARITISIETDWSMPSVEKLASVNYKFTDIAADISSGSYRTDGMVIIPCSMHTLGALACGQADNLLTRAAEVSLKERRPLIVVPRETPMSLIHLENMVRIAQAGAIVVPAMPAFYPRPKTVEQVVDHLVGKVLDLLSIENSLFRRWQGVPSSSS